MYLFLSLLLNSGAPVAGESDARFAIFLFSFSSRPHRPHAVNKVHVCNEYIYYILYRCIDMGSTNVNCTFPSIQTIQLRTYIANEQERRRHIVTFYRNESSFLLSSRCAYSLYTSIYCYTSITHAHAYGIPHTRTTIAFYVLSFVFFALMKTYSHCI